MSAEPQFDGCEVVAKLRSGPVTDWYLAKQRSLGRSVLIKALGETVSPDSPFAAPLQREARLLSQLHHRNIVQLYDFVQRPRGMWLVLEYTPGRPLDEWLSEKEKLSAPVALAIVVELLSALEHVHALQIVHRDIQPRNIVISPAGELKLINFFLAAEQSAPPPPELIEGDSGFVLPSYMSPEQVLGEATEPSSDLFSVGVLLYELLTGKRPFDAEDSRTTAQRIRHASPPVLSRFLDDPPSSLERLLNRALAKLPSDRFTSALEMRLVVEQSLHEHGDFSTKDWIAGTTQAQPTRQPIAKTTAQHRAPRSPLSPVLVAARTYLLALSVFLVGAWGIQRYAGDETAEASASSAVLPLVPEQAAHFRAVVKPWAHVYIDGELVATTPFAHAVALAPGLHHVRFEHPQAQPEQREIRLAAGQHVMLDVVMQLNQPAARQPVLDLLAPPSDAGDPSP